MPLYTLDEIEQRGLEIYETIKTPFRARLKTAGLLPYTLTAATTQLGATRRKRGLHFVSGIPKANCSSWTLALSRTTGLPPGFLCFNLRHQVIEIISLNRFYFLKYLDTHLLLCHNASVLSVFTNLLQYKGHEG